MSRILCFVHAGASYQCSAEPWIDHLHAERDVGGPARGQRLLDRKVKEPHDEKRHQRPSFQAIAITAKIARIAKIHSEIMAITAIMAFLAIQSRLS